MSKDLMNWISCWRKVLDVINGNEISVNKTYSSISIYVRIASYGFIR